MSTFKTLNKQDTYITGYTAQKSWAVSGSATNSTAQSNYNSYQIQTLAGTSGSNDDLTDQSFLYNGRHRVYTYKSIKHLYYSLLNESGSLSGSYENYLQSSYIPSGSRQLDDELFVFSVGRGVTGTHIQPNTFKILPHPDDRYVLDEYAVEGSENLYIEHSDYLFGANPFASDEDYLERECEYVEEFKPTPGEYLDQETTSEIQYKANIVDDGEGNLYFENSIPRQYVGNIIYPHGQVILTKKVVAHYLSYYINPNLEWQSNHPIFTHNYHCKLKASEFNYSSNRSTLDANTGELAENINREEFTPYITTVGLYNDLNELIAVAKLGQPIPKSVDTDMTIVVKLDV